MKRFITVIGIVAMFGMFLGMVSWLKDAYLDYNDSEPKAVVAKSHNNLSDESTTITATCEEFVLFLDDGRLPPVIVDLSDDTKKFLSSLIERHEEGRPRRLPK